MKLSPNSVFEKFCSLPLKLILIIYITLSLAACGSGSSSEKQGNQGPNPEPPVPEFSDSDNDQINDDVDNCPNVSNPQQTDSDENEIGDLCEIVDSDNDGLIEISTIYQLDFIRNNPEGTSLVNNNGDHNNIGCPEVTGCFGYELVADIDFDTNGDGKLDSSDAFYTDSNEAWDPIGDSSKPFTATFDGNNFDIKNFYVKQTVNFHLGIFGEAENATFRNIKLNGDLSKVQGESWVGSLVGSALNSSIINVHSNVEVEINGLVVGGIVGELINSNISNSSYTGKINTKGYNIGGIAGTIENSTITDSFSTANITNIYTDNSPIGKLGGLVGSADNSTIDNCYTNGNIQGYSQFPANYTGGLVGELNQSSVTGSYFNGSITGAESTGGLIGRMVDSTVLFSYSISDVTAYGNFTGGLIGYAKESNIENSYSIGSVSSTSAYVGGLIGSVSLSELKQIFSIGEVELIQPESDGKLYWGGLIGSSSTSNISNCFSAGNIRNGLGIGGLIGRVGFTSSDESSASIISNCYTIGEISREENTSMYGFIYTPSVTKDNHLEVIDSYWSSEISTASTAYWSLFLQGSYNIELTNSTRDQLLCPESNGDLNCQSGSMYNNWNGDIWNFGTYEEYPGLIINEEIFRPSYNEDTNEYFLAESE